MSDEYANPVDLQELEHIEGGGRWCLDGRKERRLVRLGWIKTPADGRGFVITQKGQAKLDEAYP